MEAINDSQDLDVSLEDIKLLSSQPNFRVAGSDVWLKCHRLAVARYPPAEEFYVEELKHPRSYWREISVSLLGFHYDLEPEIIEKIRGLLLHDPDSGVRIAAAYVLGYQSKLPERNLVHSLISDSNEFVRSAAFDALLNLAGVPWNSQVKVIKRIHNGEITPNLDQLKLILSDEQLYSSLSLLEN